MRIVPTSVDQLRGKKRPPVRRPWGPQAAGILVLVLSLLIIYHGTEGNHMIRLLDGYLSGGSTQAVQAAWDQSSDPATVVQGGLAAIAQDVKGGDWTRAGNDLQTVDAAWMKAQDTYANDGVAPIDMNGMTGDLAELQMAVAARNSADALTQVANAQKTFTYMAATAVAASSPSLDQMSAVVSDLNAALQSNDIQRATADAKTLQTMLSTIKKGF